MRRPRGDSLVLGFVLLTFVGIALWLIQRTHTDEKPAYPPLTTFSGQPDGALALYELLKHAGLEPQRHTDNEYYYPDDACVVLLDSAGSMMPLSAMLDVSALRLWVERGGCLVLGSAGSALIAETLFDELQINEPTENDKGWIAVHGVEAKHDKSGTAGSITPRSRIQQSGEIYHLPAERPTLLREVRRIELADDAEELIAATPLLRSGSPVLWYRQHGEGELYWLTRPEIASNSWIQRADNHRLLLNVLSAASDGRKLYFDEHVHGYLRETPNVLALLFRTPGGRLILGLIALTLLLFAGAAVRPARFSVADIPPRRQGVELVLAQADLYQRAGARHVIADCQLDSLRRAFMQQRHLASPPSDELLLDWLAREWRGEPQQRDLLAGFLRGRMLPRSNIALLDLARTCDSAKAMLS